MKLLTSTLAVLLASFSQAYAYVLDPSCAAYKDVVVSGMKGAFDLAQAGADTFNTLASNAGSGAKREAQKDLINFIFAEALTNGNIDVTNSGWITARSKFNSVLKYNTNNGEPDATNYPHNGVGLNGWDYLSLGPDELIIYCDYQRFVEGADCNGRASPDLVCDSSVMVASPLDAGYYTCKNSFPSEAQAWVLAPTGLGIARASTLQLCPGFLSEMKITEAFLTAEQGFAPSLAVNMAKYSPRKPGTAGYTAMDYLTGFDTSLLHTMTHAVPIVAAVNVDNENSFLWNNVRRLSSTRNADNYAYFGLGSRMISPNNGAQAQRPMSDGSVQILAAAGGSKRDHSHGFEPRVIDSTITTSTSSGSSTHPSQSCSKPQTVSSCELSYSIFTPTGASTAKLSTITRSCSTTTTCLASRSSTASAIDVTATPIYDVDRDASWYTIKQSVLSEVKADSTISHITWSSESSLTSIPTTLISATSTANPCD